MGPTEFNPYWEEYLNELLKEPTQSKLRDSKLEFDLKHKYSFAVPFRQAIEVLVTHSPLIEIGAGTGYWAKLIQESGGDIIAFDVPKKKNLYFSAPGSFFKVKIGGPKKILEHPNRSLFLSWPPYDYPLAEDCLKIYKGRVFIYIGESDGGCTGNDKFFVLLKEGWITLEEIPIPQWPGIHDRMVVYERKPSNEDPSSLI